MEIEEAEVAEESGIADSIDDAEAVEGSVRDRD